ncbi:MAG: FecR domain-containing protein [Deltaproteobacteria bacterium]|nr:FecR domain-containing protein [Deltaproteobacteria bacterium]
MVEPTRVRDLKGALFALDADLTDLEAPAGSFRQLRAERAGRVTNARPWTRRLALGLSFAAAVAAGLAVVVAHRRSMPIAGFEVASRQGALRLEADGHDGVRVAAGSAELHSAALGVRLAVFPKSHVRREGKDLRVVFGQVELTVAPRPRTLPPFVVAVSDGSIEVVGTRFTIVQGDGGGHVTVHEGKVKFHRPNRAEVTLGPGQGLDWPERPAPAPDRSPAVDLPAVDVLQASAAKAPVAKAIKGRRLSPRPALAEARAPLDVAAVLAELEELRIRKRFRDLALRLQQVLPELHDRDLEESLSYELCDVLASRLKDPEAGCAATKRHQRRFPAGRYETLVSALRLELGCDGATR